MAPIELTGYLAGSIIAISLAPQVFKAWKTKSTADISLMWNIIYIFGLLLFAFYAAGIKAMPLLITNTIELLLAISLICAKLIYK